MFINLGTTDTRQAIRLLLDPFTLRLIGAPSKAMPSWLQH